MHTILGFICFAPKPNGADQPRLTAAICRWPVRLFLSFPDIQPSAGEAVGIVSGDQARLLQGRDRLLDLEQTQFVMLDNVLGALGRADQQGPCAEAGKNDSAHP